MSLWWPFGGVHVNVTIEQGAHGRWRWFARDKNNALHAASGVAGYETEDEAREAAKVVAHAKWHI